MSETEPQRVTITLDISPVLLRLFDSACEKEFHEPGKRSLKLRSLIREYIALSEV